MKARQEAGGRRQEEDHYSIKTGFGVITPKDKGGWEKEIRTFSTMTKDLLNLSDWLTSKGCTHVAMESTGEYWRPVFNI